MTCAVAVPWGVCDCPMHTFGVVPRLVFAWNGGSMRSVLIESMQLNDVKCSCVSQFLHFDWENTFTTLHYIFFGIPVVKVNKTPPIIGGKMAMALPAGFSGWSRTSAKKIPSRGAWDLRFVKQWEHHQGNKLWRICTWNLDFKVLPRFQNASQFWSYHIWAKMWGSPAPRLDPHWADSWPTTSTSRSADVALCCSNLAVVKLIYGRPVGAPAVGFVECSFYQG